MTDIIEEFQGKHRFLSNFWPAEVAYAGFWYKSVECAYVAAKSLDPVFHEKMSQITDPGTAKRMGRKIKVRPDWDLVKVRIMRDLVAQKFEHPFLAEGLLATGGAILQEGNSWGDKFWGICKKTGEGENHLGRILMEIRDQLASAADSQPLRSKADET